MRLSRIYRAIRSKKLLWVLAGLVLLGGAELRRRLQRAALVREFESKGGLAYQPPPDAVYGLPLAVRHFVEPAVCKYTRVESFAVRCDENPPGLFGRVLELYPTVSEVYLKGPVSDHARHLTKLPKLADLSLKVFGQNQTMDWLEPLEKLERLKVDWSGPTPPRLNCRKWRSADSLTSLELIIGFDNDYEEEVEQQLDYFDQLSSLHRLKTLTINAEHDSLWALHLRFLSRMPHLQQVTISARDFYDEEQIQPLIPPHCKLTTHRWPERSGYADAPRLLALILTCAEDPHALRTHFKELDLAECLNRERYRGRSALHWMASLWAEKTFSRDRTLLVTRILLDEGASPDVRDSEGVSVVERFASIPELNALLASPDALPATVQPGNSK